MPRWTKITIGLAVALLAGWLYHGPYGGGAAFADALEERAQIRLRATQLPGVTVAMERDPLARVVVLSGRANEFQRKGLPGFPGIDERMRSIPGVAAMRWQGETGGRWVPLILETLILCALAFAIGLGAGRFLFTRAKRTSYLD
jgi:hypothetical protein